MPTPFGHALAGLAIATAVARPGHARKAAYWGGAAILACLPDAELLIGRITGQDLHHGPFHTIPFAAGVGLLAAGLARGGAWTRFRWFAFASACVGSHLLLDLMRWTHPASLLEIFWPFSDRGVALPMHLFHHSPSFDEALTSQGFRLLIRNVVTELAVLGTLLLFFWQCRVGSFSSTSDARPHESRPTGRRVRLPARWPGSKAYWFRKQDDARRSG